MRKSDTIQPTIIPTTTRRRKKTSLTDQILQRELHGILQDDIVSKIELESCVSKDVPYLFPHSTPLGCFEFDSSGTVLLYNATY